MIDRAAGLALALALSLLLSTTAHAGDREQAAHEMDRANAHLERREYDSAIASFNAARALAPASSGPYLGLGLAYAATQRCREATAYLEEYLHRAKTPKPEAAATLADCRAHLVPPARVSITSDPSGAEVRFDSESAPPAGTTPFETTTLVKGAHRVFLTRAGYRPHAAEVKVEPGVSAVVTAALEPLAPPPPPLLVEPITPPQRPPERPPDRPPPDVQNLPTPSLPPPVVRPPAPLPNYGELAIASTDPTATVYLNSQQISTDGHLRLRLPPGLYAVAVEREGYRGTEGAVPLVAGERKAFTAPIRRLKTHGWLSLGIAFTFFAVIAEGTALAAHFANQNGMPGTDSFNTLTSVELYGHVTAASTAAIAILGYVLEGVTNMGRVNPGPAYPLAPDAWPDSPRR